MNPEELPKGTSSERSGGQINRAGKWVLRRPEADGGDIIAYTVAGLDGDVQADAFARLGYERVGEPLNREELLEMQSKQADKDAPASDASKADKSEKTKNDK